MPAVELPLRVCLVAPAPPPYGGIANWTRLIHRTAMDRTDVELDLVNTAVKWRDVDDLAAWKRVIGGGGQLIRDLTRLCGSLRRRPDVIHLITSGQLALVRDILIMKLAHSLGVPVVYHLRFGRIPDLANAETSQEWRYLRRALRLATKVLALDSKTTKTVSRLLPEVDVAQVPNCVDIAALPLPEATTASVVYLGWVIPTKGIEELVRAWAELAPGSWKLLMVGPGNRNYQEQLLSKYRPRNVEFVGELPHGEAMRVLGRAAAVVLPSHTEGFPNVVMEAMALGKPVIATRVGAMPEMLEEGCCLLVDKGDVNGLKGALETVMNDAELRRTMGQRNAVRAQQYSLSNVFSQYMRHWRSAAGRGEMDSVCE